MPTRANDTTMAIVDEIFATFPGRFRFTSGLRTAAQNRAVNGAANSFHLTGQAADFVPIDGRFPAGELDAIARIVARHGYEVIRHNAGSGMHYHIEPAPGYVRNTASANPLPGTAGGDDTRSSPISGGTVLMAAAGLVVFALLLDD
jgi:hypothetical protein